MVCQNGTSGVLFTYMGEIIMKMKKSVKRAFNYLKAKTLLEVLMETGTLNMTEASRRVYKNRSPDSHKGNAPRDFGSSEILEMVMRMARADDKAVAKLGTTDIRKELISDINKINAMIEGGELGPETMAQYLRLKDQKLKLLGAELGMWKSDKPQKSVETDPDKLFNKFGGRN